MAFRVPAMPVQVGLWRSAPAGGALLYSAPDATFFGNLSPGKRVMVQPTVITNFNITSLPMELLCPKRTDIRAKWNAIAEDVVEVPFGSQRFYQVGFVDDVARNFANEYRIALIIFSPLGFTFNDVGPLVVPVPLP